MNQAPSEFRVRQRANRRVAFRMGVVAAITLFIGYGAIQQHSPVGLAGIVCAGDVIIVVVFRKKLFHATADLATPQKSAIGQSRRAKVA